MSSQESRDRTRESSQDGQYGQSGWHFLSNHAQVLICIARDPDIRLRDVAVNVGITERAVQRLVADLVTSGHIDVERAGRRNRYVVNREVAMRHPAQADQEIGQLLDLLARPPEA